MWWSLPQSENQQGNHLTKYAGSKDVYAKKAEKIGTANDEEGGE